MELNTATTKNLHGRKTKKYARLTLVVVTDPSFRSLRSSRSVSLTLSNISLTRDVTSFRSISSVTTNGLRFDICPAAPAARSTEGLRGTRLSLRFSPRTLLSSPLSLSLESRRVNAAATFSVRLRLVPGRGIEAMSAEGSRLLL